MDTRSQRVDPETIQRLRRQKAWSQQKLAEQAGCHKRTIERLEKGCPGLLDTLARVAKALGVEPQTVCDVAAAPLLDRQAIVIQHTKEYMTVEEASQRLDVHFVNPAPVYFGVDNV